MMLSKPPSNIFNIIIPLSKNWYNNKVNFCSNGCYGGFSNYRNNGRATACVRGKNHKHGNELSTILQ